MTFQRRFINPLLIFMTAYSLFAEDYDRISPAGFIRIQGSYQEYKFENDMSFSESTGPIELYWPISRENSLAVSTSYTEAKGTRMRSLSGLTDTRISWNYYLRKKHVVFNLGLGLPTGKSTLSEKEFNTSVLLSQHYWNFYAPTLGQGFNLSPGLTWALPLSDGAVAGLGLAYQVRGGFIPLKGMKEVYKPGNELLLTGGLDFRAGTLSTFSWDLIATLYASDTIDDSVAYQSGSKIVTSLQFKTFLGYDAMTCLVRFRSKSKNQLLSAAGNLVPENEKTYPNQLEVIGQYKHRHSSRVFITYCLKGRFFQELEVYPGLNILGGSINPEWNASRKTQVFGILEYGSGSFSTEDTIRYLEAGIGLIVHL